MAEGKAILRLSAAFAIGTAAGILIAGNLAAMPQAAYITAGVAMISAGAALLWSLLGGMPHRKETLLFIFLQLGISSGAMDTAFGQRPESAIEKTVSEAADKVKEKFHRIPYDKETTLPLVLALTMGDRSMLPKETVRIFRQSGASHILALSGLHLGILYVMLLYITSPFGLSVTAIRLRAILIILLTSAYAALTGASPSIMRAALFVILKEVSKISGRKAGALHVLAEALLLQLAFSPSAITSVGFQLSYLAMSGITLIYPPMRTWYPGNPEADRAGIPRKIWEAIALSFSCQLFTAPVVLLHFRTFPVYFLITNLSAMPVTTVLMILSVAVIVLSAIGIYPDWLIAINEKTADTLIWILTVISEL